VTAAALEPADLVGLASGDGLGAATELLESVIYPRLRVSGGQDDGAWTPTLAGAWQVVTTDLFAVDPIEFPGGNIGKLAAAGCINDLLASGARARTLTVGLYLSAYLQRNVLGRMLDTFRTELDRAGAEVVCGDTKVHPGRDPLLLLAVTAVGEPIGDRRYALAEAVPGDLLMVTGPLGAHTIAVLSAREGLGFERVVRSDVQPLLGPIGALVERSLARCLRDLTRGGLVGALWEGARATDLLWEIDADAVPVDRDVRAAAELLGLDPLTLANEGTMLLVVPPAEAEEVLRLLRGHDATARTAVVGRIAPAADGVGAAVVRDGEGSVKVLPYPAGIGIPRLC
jgi:hydrogenase expression/formation protein HypE